MSVPITSRRGRAALMVAHCAGMVDLVALPIWVGSLIQHHRFDPQQAGGLVTLFLLGAVLSSVLLAPRFHRLQGRWVAVAGFSVAALSFAALMDQNAFGPMAALHGLAGLAAGSALSVTHGTIGRSGQPHRLFALVGMALGVFAVLFLGGASALVMEQGGQLLFGLFGGLMAFAAVVAWLAFPDVAPTADDAPQDKATAATMPRVVWFGIAGISCMGLVQAMAFSFLERVGHHRGFEPQAITAVLVALGMVNLLPAALAAVLEKRLPAHRVLMSGPVVQAALVFTVMTATAFAPYAAAAAVFVAVMIFTHTFAFGLMARIDTTGRALAGTPAMLMAGAAVGPILGGTLVKTLGYSAIAFAALGMALVAVACFAQLRGHGLPVTASKAASGAAA